jgi:hypothetical protein
MLDLEFKNETSGQFTVTPEGASPFTIDFGWHWWENGLEDEPPPREPVVWIGARKLASVPAKSVGEVRSGRLTLKVTASEPIQLLGKTNTVLEVNATEQP